MLSTMQRLKSWRQTESVRLVELTVALPVSFSNHPVRGNGAEVAGSMSPSFHQRDWLQNSRVL